jgi:cell division protein FtsN
MARRMKSAPDEEGRHTMTTMGKTLFVLLSLGALFGATLALRTEHTPATPAQLTPAQMAEVQPAPKPADPPKATPARAPDPEDEAPPDLELEDGSGS